MDKLFSDELITYADNDYLLNYQIKKITLNKFLQKKNISFTLAYFSFFFS